jgi:FkbM family methyltransferase
MHTIPVYRHVYRNYFNVLVHIARNNYPIKAIVRNGDYTVLLRDHSQSFYTTFLLFHNISYDVDNNSVRVPYVQSETGDTYPVLLYDAINNGDVVNIFVDNVYQKLPVKGKILVDVGANIGDSAIYFALKGATKIIALEPFPKNYETAKKNVELNNLSSVVTLLLAGCSGNGGYITMDPTYESGLGGSLVESSRSGIKVPLLTLENILAKSSIRSDDSVVLKMDCEGCEYEGILYATPETLKCFGCIQVEYHFGYKNLKEKLEQCGFSVSVTPPEYLPSTSNPHAPKTRRKTQYVGYLYAMRM